MGLKRKIVAIFMALALLSSLSAGLTYWSITAQDEERERLVTHLTANAVLERISAPAESLFRRQALITFLSSESALRRLRETEDNIEKALVRHARLAITPAAREAHTRLAEAFLALRSLLDDFKLPSANDDAAIAMKNDASGHGDTGTAAVETALVRAETWIERIRASGAPETFRRALEATLTVNAEEQARASERIEELRETILLAVNVTAIVTLVLVLLLGGYLLTDVFRPLRAIERALVGLSSGDWSLRLPTGRDDEIGKVGRSFNALAEALALGTFAGAKGEGGPLSAYLASRRDGTPGEITQEELVRMARELERLVAAKVGTRVDFDARGLLLELLGQVQHRFVELGAGLSVAIPAEAPRVVGDPLRLREFLLGTLEELMTRNELLPDFSIGLVLEAASPDGQAPRNCIEVQLIRGRASSAISLEKAPSSRGVGAQRNVLMTAMGGDFIADEAREGGEVVLVRYRVRLAVQAV